MKEADEMELKSKSKFTSHMRRRYFGMWWCLVVITAARSWWLKFIVKQRSFARHLHVWRLLSLELLFGYLVREEEFPQEIFIHLQARIWLIVVPIVNTIPVQHESLVCGIFRRKCKFVCWRHQRCKLARQKRSIQFTHFHWKQIKSLKLLGESRYLTRHRKIPFQRVINGWNSSYSN